MINDELRTKLAAQAHAAWARSMKYLFANAIVNADGTATIPARLVTRWTRQIATVYAYLPPAEKLSDLAEADAILALLAPEAAP